MNNSFILKGNICQTKTMRELDLNENSYVVCIDGVSKGIFKDIPNEYRNLEVMDLRKVYCHIHNP